MSLVSNTLKSTTSSWRWSNSVGLPRWRQLRLWAMGQRRKSGKMFVCQPFLRRFQCLNSYRVDLPAGEKYTIRFSSGFGNTILLSDMNKTNQGIWNADIHGRIRRKIGEYVSFFQFLLSNWFNLRAVLIEVLGRERLAIHSGCWRLLRQQRQLFGHLLQDFANQGFPCWR